jgi:homoserine kinase
VAEPARAPLLPGFLEAKRAALAAGAFGCSISGSGPTAFAFSRDPSSARRVGDAMAAAYQSAGVEATARVCGIDDEGARVLGDAV